MHVPAAWAETDPDRLHAFIRCHSFATLVSSDPDSRQPPVATHLPLILETAPGEPSRLIGHFARANSHWMLAADRPVLAIFSGPHAYMSAGWYGERNVVPTWNYVVVHVTGRLTLEEDTDRLLELVDRMTRSYESGSATPWQLESTDPEFRRKLVQSIVGFRIEIEHIQGCWKLSQQHPPQRRRNAIEGLLQRGTGDDRTIAELMQSASPGG